MPNSPQNEDGGSLLQRTIEQLRSANSARPRAVDIPKIPGALVFYRTTAYITGIMLLLLVVEMILKYGVGYSVYAFSPGKPVIALLAYNPAAPNAEYPGVDLSLWVLIVHGWLYVVYLIADFRLWSLMRMSFTKFIQIALGGVVPFMSFIVEHFITRQVKHFLAESSADSRASKSPVEASH
jgi:integral membrane protein